MLAIYFIVFGERAKIFPSDKNDSNTVVMHQTPFVYSSTRLAVEDKRRGAKRCSKKVHTTPDSYTLAGEIEDFAVIFEESLFI